MLTGRETLVLESSKYSNYRVSRYFVDVDPMAVNIYFNSARQQHGEFNLPMWFISSESWEGGKKKSTAETDGFLHLQVKRPNKPNSNVASMLK